MNPLAYALRVVVFIVREIKSMVMTTFTSYVRLILTEDVYAPLFRYHSSHAGSWQDVLRTISRILKHDPADNLRQSRSHS